MARHSPATLTFSQISRHTGVPRATLYYYFGNSRANLVKEAIRLGMGQFVLQERASGFAEFSSWRAWQADRMARSLLWMKKYPWIIDLYFKHRGMPGEFGELIRDFEGRYMKMTLEGWKHFKRAEPSPESFYFAAYLKLGLFYGFSHDARRWKGRRALTHRYLGQFVELLEVLSLRQGR